jgi:hypothetical protein
LYLVTLQPLLNAFRMILMFAGQPQHLIPLFIFKPTHYTPDKKVPRRSRISGIRSLCRRMKS